MSPSLKHLHDALMIISRDRKHTEQAIQCASTDINDSEENFLRRFHNLEAQALELKAEADKLLKARDVVIRSMDEMVRIREAGTSELTALRTKLRQLDLNEKTIQLAILQQEATSCD